MKSSTFLFAYAADFDILSFNQMKNVVVQTLTVNRNKYSKLGMVQFDTAPTKINITYFDDVQTFSAALTNNPPNPKIAAGSSTTSNVLSVISKFLANPTVPLESSMVVLLIKRWPDIDSDLTHLEYSSITNKDIKIFTITSDNDFNQQFASGIGSYIPLNSLSVNSNGHFLIGKYGQSLVQAFQNLVSTPFSHSLALTSSFSSVFGVWNKTIGQLKVPHSESSNVVNFTITISVEIPQSVINSKLIQLIFYDSETTQKVVKLQSLKDTNFYIGTVQLKERSTYQVLFQASLNFVTIPMIRIWTKSKLSYYGSYVSLNNPMSSLETVDEYQGAALRMELLNDCYTSHAASVIITDCAGVISAKYDSIQNIQIDYIFTGNSTFPHYSFVPFFCDQISRTEENCVPGTLGKYNIQFVAGEFTVIRSFQCRPGVGKINSNCRNLDSNGNYYCNRNQLPYMRGPTGQVPDCLGHGHVEYEFSNSKAYVCICNKGYSGVSCETKV